MTDEPEETPVDDSPVEEPKADDSAKAESSTASSKKKSQAAAKKESKADDSAKAESSTASSKKKSQAAAKKEPKADDSAKAESSTASSKKKSQAAAKKEPKAAAVVVRAHAKYVRMSARKARLVCDNIRGKSVEDARTILALTPRAAAQDWSKLLESAVANAENNHDLDGDDLRILTIKADEGPTLKRFRPRAQGRASAIHKRTAHLSIALGPKER